MLGGARLVLRMGHLRGLHPVFIYGVGSHFPGRPKEKTPRPHFRQTPAPLDTPAPASVPGQGIDRRSGLLPNALAFEPHIADAASPRRDHAADRPKIAAIGVLLIEPPHDIRRHANERSQRRRRLDAVFPASPRARRRPPNLLEIVHENLLESSRKSAAFLGRQTRRWQTASSAPERSAPAPPAVTDAKQLDLPCSGESSRSFSARTTSCAAARRRRYRAGGRTG